MRSPKWLRDESILCLDLYLNHNGIKIQKNDPKVAELSDTLNKLPIVSNKVEFEKFRNENGVIMKLGNFKQWDPTYMGKGLGEVFYLAKEYLINENEYLTNLN